MSAVLSCAGWGRAAWWEADHSDLCQLWCSCSSLTLQCAGELWAPQMEKTLSQPELWAFLEANVWLYFKDSQNLSVTTCTWVWQRIRVVWVLQTSRGKVVWAWNWAVSRRNWALQNSHQGEASPHCHIGLSPPDLGTSWRCWVKLWICSWGNRSWRLQLPLGGISAFTAARDVVELEAWAGQGVWEGLRQCAQPGGIVEVFCEGPRAELCGFLPAQDILILLFPESSAKTCSAISDWHSQTQIFNIHPPWSL